MTIQWIIEDKRRCCSCKEYKSFSEFHKDKSAPAGLAYSCKVCAIERSRANHRIRMQTKPEYRKQMKNRYIKQRHGITLPEYMAKMEEQKTCSICNLEFSSMAISNVHLDHDHDSNKLRDFLCTNCNRGLGHFQDSIELLTEAAEYLRKHKK